MQTLALPSATASVCVGANASVCASACVGDSATASASVFREYGSLARRLRHVTWQPAVGPCLFQDG